MEIRTYRGGADRNLSYLVHEGGKGFVVDASVEPTELLADAELLGIGVQYLFVTHSHADHLTWVRPILEATGATLVSYLADLALPGHLFYPAGDGTEIDVGDLRVRFLHTPGHASDHLAILAGDALFTGDLLFVGGTGRTISPGSDNATLFRSLATRIAPLPGAVTIYPGHDYGPTPTDTLERQRATNPFLRALDPDQFQDVMDQYEASRRG